MPSFPTCRLRLNTIGPGLIETQLLKNVMNAEAARRMVLSRTPLGRLGQPEEIASVGKYLANSIATSVTGQTLFADGGHLSLNYTASVRVRHKLSFDSRVTENSVFGSRGD